MGRDTPDHTHTLRRGIPIPAETLFNPPSRHEYRNLSHAWIDEQLRDVGWNVTDGRSVRFECTLPNGLRVNYVVCERPGRAMAVIEAKRASRSLAEGEAWALDYAEALGVPFVFLANGEEAQFRDLGRDADFRPVATIFGQDDPERRLALRLLRVPPASVPIPELNRPKRRRAESANPRKLAKSFNVGGATISRLAV